MNNQIQELVATSVEVIRDCSLKNGAIVAANSSKPYFPKEAKNYKFVWPRDGAYICIAANILEIPIQEEFFKWCMRAEGWEKTGLFYENYYTSGRKCRRSFQPDQTGSVLVALWDYFKDKKGCRKFEKLIRKSADGLCNVWDKDHFKLLTQDLWEERLCFPDLKENFTYSLAACYKGLLCANELIKDRRWVKTANEMKEVLLRESKDYFCRSFGILGDKRVDASLLGLVWPFGVVSAKDKRIVKTVKMIEEKIVKDKGVYRYEHDKYDGWMYKKVIHRYRGAGYWPLLSFWMSIYYLEKGDRKKALEYYNKVLRDVRQKRFIPEQIFDNNIQVGVSPLCWSHSMFVIASKKLGYI